MGENSGKKVVYAVLRAAARVGIAVRTPSKSAQQWLRLAHFHELRKSGLTVPEASRELGVSEPTGARLARELRGDFIADEAEHDLPKRIAFALWPGSMSRARLLQVLPDVEPERLDAALVKLERDERIKEKPGRTPTYAVTQKEDRLVGPTSDQRLGALNSLLDNLVEVISARFFQEREDAFARTVSFRMAEEDAVELRRFYDEKFFPFLATLEEKSAKSNSVAVTRLSLLWASAPKELDKKRKKK